MEDFTSSVISSLICSTFMNVSLSVFLSAYEEGKKENEKQEEEEGGGGIAPPHPSFLTSLAKILVMISFFWRFRSGVLGLEEVEVMEAITEEVRFEPTPELVVEMLIFVFQS